MIYGERIKQARELKRFTQSELARRLGINQSAVTQIETGRFVPSQAVLDAVARETDVLPVFFEQQPFELSSLGSLAYRAHATINSRERRQASQYLRLLVEHVQHMAKYLTIPSLQLPTEESPIRAARLARLAFGLSPLVPVPHLLNRLERHGVIVFSLPSAMETMDAFSVWTLLDQRRPIVVLSSGRPGDRIRYSAAHELGHLIMHKQSEINNGALEGEANKFAAEFLLPEQAIRQSISERMNLTDAARLKSIWRVSMQALIRRARDLRIIDERRYRYLFEQISKKGWRKSEPIDVPIERPRLYRQMAEMLYGSHKKEHLGLDSGIGPMMTKELMAQYDPAISNNKFMDTEPYYSGRWSNIN